MELGEVHAVGDDLVLAREEAADEVPRGRADRDPAVQPLGEALHHPLPELV
jgi:hypothetical protein